MPRLEFLIRGFLRGTEDKCQGRNFMSLSMVHDRYSRLARSFEDFLRRILRERISLNSFSLERISSFKEEFQHCHLDQKSGWEEWLRRAAQKIGSKERFRKAAQNLAAAQDGKQKRSWVIPGNNQEVWSKREKARLEESRYEPTFVGLVVVWSIFKTEREIC